MEGTSPYPLIEEGHDLSGVELLAERGEAWGECSASTGWVGQGGYHMGSANESGTSSGDGVALQFGIKRLPF
jgi:hypothetical protein